MKKLNEHIQEHLFAWLSVGMFSLAVGGGLAYMDTRHLQRTEAEAQMKERAVQRIEDQIEAIDADISRLQFYNMFGSEANSQARERVIVEQTARRDRKRMEWEKITQQQFVESE